MEASNNTTTELTFEERVEQRKQANIGNIHNTRLSSEVAIDDTLRRQASRKMTALIKDVGDLVGLDEERLERRIKATRKSEYGRIPGMINLLASIYAWPVPVGGQASDIDGLQEDIIELLTEKSIIIDKDLLIDIKESKGFHTFCNDEAELINGEEPDYSEYSYFVLTFADHAQLPLVDEKLSSTKWSNTERLAVTKATDERDLALEALERHKALDVA